MKEAADILNRAADLVGGDRASAHGEAVESLQAIGELWGHLLSLMGKPLPEPLEARDVAILMAGLKIVRAYKGDESSDDNYVDMAGYAGLAGAVRKYYIPRPFSFKPEAAPKMSRSSKFGNQKVDLP